MAIEARGVPRRLRGAGGLSYCYTTRWSVDPWAGSDMRFCWALQSATTAAAAKWRPAGLSQGRHSGTLGEGGSDRRAGLALSGREAVARTVFGAVD
jgi:hypothetical protein